MKLERKLSALRAQIDEANKGVPTNLNGWREKTEVTLRTVMGPDHPLLQRFAAIKYSPVVYGSGVDVAAYKRRGVRTGIDILNAAIAELNLTADVEEEITTAKADPTLEGEAEHGRIFIVHGHSGSAKHELARVLQALSGADPVILHDEPNRGMVLIEKFEKAAAATGFAVALLTADDVGGAQGADDLRARARQNVVFETGFFIGAFGRGRVAVLVEEGVERPSDLQGLVYIELDRNGGWKPQLARELKAAGMPVNFEVLGSVELHARDPRLVFESGVFVLVVAWPSFRSAGPVGAVLGRGWWTAGVGHCGAFLWGLGWWGAGVGAGQRHRVRFVVMSGTLHGLVPLSTRNSSTHTPIHLR